MMQRTKLIAAELAELIQATKFRRDSVPLASSHEAAKAICPPEWAGLVAFIVSNYHPSLLEWCRAVQRGELPK